MIEDVIRTRLHIPLLKQTVQQLAFRGYGKDLERIFQSVPAHQLLEIVSDGAVLCAAAYSGDMRSVELVFRCHGDVTVTDECGRTPLHRACAGGHKQVVDFLLVHKASVNCVDEEGLSPLHCAAQWGRAQVVGSLVDGYHAAVDARDQAGRTPLHTVAGLQGFPQERVLATARALVQRGADVHATDSQGRTPVDIARACKIQTLVQLLEP